MFISEDLMTIFIIIISLTAIIFNIMHLTFNWRKILRYHFLLNKEFLNKPRPLRDNMKIIIVSPCKFSSAREKEIIMFKRFIENAVNNDLVEKIFLISDESDPRIFKEISNSQKIKMLMTEDLCKYCSGKNKALITGVKRLREEYEKDLSKDLYILFVDCDAYFHDPENMFRKILSIFSYREKMFLTGYRWYVMRNLCNTLHNIVSTMYFETVISRKTIIVWGGFMMIRAKDLFESNVEKELENEIADDAVMRKVFDKKGFEIIFCPECIGFTDLGDMRGCLKDFIRWAERQLLMIRIYTPRGFRYVYIGYLTMTLLMIMPLILLPINYLMATYLIMFFTTPLYLIGSLRASILVLFYRKIFGSKDLLGKTLYIILYILMNGLRAFIALALLTRVIFLKEILWREKRYVVMKIGGRIKAVPSESLYEMSC